MKSTLGSDDRAQLEHAFHDAVRSVQAGEWERWAALYTDDAVLCAPNAPIVRGREAILEWGRSLEVESIAFREIEVCGEAGGDMAYGISIYELALAGMPSDVGTQLVVFRRDQDGWRAVAVSFNSDLPVEAPAV